MKHVHFFNSFISIFFVFAYATAQSGDTRPNAREILIKPICQPEEFTSPGSEMWFKFTAQSERVAIRLSGNNFGNNQAHIHNLELYKSNETQALKEDELPFNAQAHRLNIDLNAAQLEIGQEYYLRADRKAHTGNCKHGQCTQNNFSNPAVFRLCVSQVDVLIPEDLNHESPVVQHAFELSRGQLVDTDGKIVNNVLAFSRGSVPQTYVAEQYTAYVWAKIDEDTTTVDSLERIDLELLNANLNENFLRADEYASHSNYYLGHNPDGILGNKSYARLIRQNVYPDIDQHFYSNETGIKQYFVVQNGADHQQIQLHFIGAQSTEITTDGGLLVKTRLGSLRLKPALVYNINQAGYNVPMPASGRFVESGSNTYGIAVENYPLNRPLVIEVDQFTDPPTRGENDPEWTTYVGGDNHDLYTCVDALVDSNMYVGGKTISTDFPTQNDGIYSGNPKGLTDGVVSCFNVNHELVWSTYMGGGGNDMVMDLAYDATKNICFITGTTGSGENSFQARLPDGNTTAYMQLMRPLDSDTETNLFSFVARMTDKGGIDWNTTLAGNVPGNQDQNIEVDQNGNIYVAGVIGYTDAINTCTPPPGTGFEFPRCVSNNGSYKGAGDNIHIGKDTKDAFISKFAPDLSLLWSVLYGGEQNDYIFDMAIDNANQKLYVGGYTASQPDVVTPGACGVASSELFPICNKNNYAFFDPVYNGGDTTTAEFLWGDGFISQFDFDGKLEWSTYLGGTKEDGISGLDVDEAGNLYVVGYTISDRSVASCTAPASNYFPNCNAIGGDAPKSVLGGTNDCFVAKFSLNKDLLWMGYIGGGAADVEPFTVSYQMEGFPSISANAKGDFYIAGSTVSGSKYAAGAITTLGNGDYYNQAIHADYLENGPEKSDKFVLHYTPDMQLDWGSYFGGASPGSKSEFAGDVKAADNKVYLCGGTFSTNDFPYFCPTIPLKEPYCQPATAATLNTGNSDAFVAQLVINPQLKVQQLSGKLPLLLQPNPTNDGCMLRFDAASAGMDELLILNQLGQVCHRQTINYQTGTNKAQINTNMLPAGIYFVSFAKNQSYSVSKLVKL